MIKYSKEEGIIMKTNYIKSFLLAALTAGILTTSNITTVIAVPVASPVKQTNVQTQAQGIYVKPLTVVNSPKTYLNKSIIMEAKFDKFSTLGLDYKPAFKSSEDYISFLIKRDDTSFNIPLSEMKLFLKRDVAEKFIDLKTDDEIQINGVVFSDALGDTWVDVKSLKITKKAPDEKTK
jgi:hypothetical protein